MKSTEMYLNVQIIQCILFYFCFVNCFRDSSVVNDIYWTTLKKHGDSYISKIFKGHDKFIEMPELTWITTCKSVTKELRNNEGYLDVYVDYRATSKYTGKRCIEILVWVPRISENVKQVACYCFIRPSILALDMPHEYNQYNRKVMIYPKNVRSLMVFEENKDQGNFYPLEIYDNRRWLLYSPADVNIFTTALPQSYGDVSNLETILDPIFYDLGFDSWSHVNVITRYHGVYILCKTILQRARYFGTIIFSPKDNVPQERQVVILVLRTGKGEPKVIKTSTHDCSRFIPKTVETTITNYKIAPGPNLDSVLVIRETDCPRKITYDKSYARISGLICYEIVELIEYLSYEYVDIYY